MSELVALLSASGEVVGAEERVVVRRDNLLHGATAVLVRNTARQIYVHLRAAEKDWAPSHHDAAAGGMLRYGEAPAEAASRELGEELGITAAELRPLGLSLYEDDATRVVEHCFETTWDGVIEFTDREVIAGCWMTLAELASRLADPDWLFVPDTRALLERLRRQAVGDYARLQRS